MQGIENQEVMRPRSWWIDLCFIVAGLAFDWYCAFEWVSGRYSLLSEPVLRRFGLIAVLCAAVAFLAVCVVRRATLRDAVGIFFVASGLTWGNLSMWWVVHR